MKSLWRESHFKTSLQQKEAEVGVPNEHNYFHATLIHNNEVGEWDTEAKWTNKLYELGHL